MVGALRALYATRLAAREIGWALQWIPAACFLSVHGNRIDFDLSDFIQRVLLKNGKRGRQEEYIEAIDRWSNKLSGDCRNYIRGHDFIELLAWSIQHFGGVRAFASHLAVERLLVLLSSQAPALGAAIQ